MAAKDVLGRRGEALAADFLVAGGRTVLDQNWRCEQGEIDLILDDGGETVFVEVKTRSSLAYGHPLEAITVPKLARLRRLAAAWCAQQTRPHRRIRIDAVAVLLLPGEEPLFDHVERVF